MNNVVPNSEKQSSTRSKNDKKVFQEHVDKLVLESVEEVLNKLLNAEADAICNESRQERSPDLFDTRAGTYKRSDPYRVLIEKTGIPDVSQQDPSEYRPRIGKNREKNVFLLFAP